MAEELLEALSTFIKAVAIYPENNDRVRTNLDRVIKALEVATTDERCTPLDNAPILFDREQAFVGKIQVPLREGSNPDWLRERLDKTLLVGFELEPGITPESLFAFSRELLDQYTRSQLDQEFDQPWSDSVPGIKLRHRLFDGVFSELSDLPPLPDLDQPEGEVTLSSEQTLAVHLLEDPDVRTRLEGVEQRMEVAREEGEDIVSIDFLTRLVKLMPADAMLEFENVRELAKDVLDSILERLDAAPEGSSTSPVEDERLSRLLFLSSRKYFAREAPSGAEVVEQHEQEEGKQSTIEADRRKASDDEVTDDLDLFLNEIRDLPPLAEEDVPRNIEVPSEQLGVYLHFLAQTDDPRLIDAMRPALRRLLTAPGTELLGILAAYLKRHADEDEETARTRFARVSRFLLSEQMASLVRRSGVLSFADVMRSFPSNFVLLLHGLDLDDAKDVSLLKELWTKVGVGGIEESEAMFVEQGLLEWDLPNRLLALPDAALLPFASVVLRHGGDRFKLAAIGYLRSLGIETREACLLRILESPASVPNEYLVGLIQQLCAGAHAPRDPALTEMIGKQICQYVIAHADDPTSAERRAYAIRFLGEFRTPESKELLGGMLQDKKLLLLSREPKCVRDAARQVLNRY